MARKKGLANFGSKRAKPFGSKGGGSVPKGGYKPGGKSSGKSAAKAK